MESIIDIIKKYRLHSKYYLNMSYFVLISFIIIFLVRYFVINYNHIILPFPLALLQAFVVLIFIPIGFIYYIIRMSIDVYKIGKNKFDETRKNRLIWFSDIIYILFFASAFLSTIRH